MKGYCLYYRYAPHISREGVTCTPSNRKSKRHLGNRIGESYLLTDSRRRTKLSGCEELETYAVDDGFDNPVYHLFPSKPPCSDRSIGARFLPSFIYYGLGGLGDWYGASHGANSDVPKTGWCT